MAVCQSIPVFVCVSCAVLNETDRDLFSTVHSAKCVWLSSATHRSLYAQERDVVCIIQKAWCAPCPVCFCWLTAVYTTNEWMKFIKYLLVNKLKFVLKLRFCFEFCVCPYVVLSVYVSWNYEYWVGWRFSSSLLTKIL
jgi:hypothetical protein